MAVNLWIRFVWLRDDWFYGMSTSYGEILCRGQYNNYGLQLYTTQHKNVFNQPHGQECDTRSIFKRSKVGLSSEFSFFLTSCQIKAKEPSLPNYLPIAKRRSDGFMPFMRPSIIPKRPEFFKGGLTPLQKIQFAYPKPYQEGLLKSEGQLTLARQFTLVNKDSFGFFVF